MSTYLDSKIGLPLSSVSSSASSSMFFSTRSANRHSSRPRSLVDILRHGRARAPVPTRALFGFKLCRPLLDVSSQAFLCIFTLEKQLLVLALEGQRSFQRNLPAGLHGALDATYRFRRFVGRAELARILHHVFHEAVALVNV